MGSPFLCNGYHILPYVTSWLVYITSPHSAKRSTILESYRPLNLPVCLPACHAYFQAGIMHDLSFGTFGTVFGPKVELNPGDREQKATPPEDKRPGVTDFISPDYTFYGVFAVRRGLCCSLVVISSSIHTHSTGKSTRGSWSCNAMHLPTSNNVQTCCLFCFCGPGFAASTGLQIYALNPLLVMHSGGVSNTWKNARKDKTGRDDYITYSGQIRTPFEAHVGPETDTNSDVHTDRVCLFSDPLYNSSLLAWFERNDYFDTLEDALKGCASRAGCTGVTQSTRVPGKLKRSFYLGTELDYTFYHHQHQMRLKDPNYPVPLDIPISYMLDPSRPCLNQLPPNAAQKFLETSSAFKS